MKLNTEPSASSEQSHHDQSLFQSLVKQFYYIMVEIYNLLIKYEETYLIIQYMQNESVPPAKAQGEKKQLHKEQILFYNIKHIRYYMFLATYQYFTEHNRDLSALLIDNLITLFTRFNRYQDTINNLYIISDEFENQIYVELMKPVKNEYVDMGDMGLPHYLQHLLNTLENSNLESQDVQRKLLNLPELLAIKGSIFEMIQQGHENQKQTLQHYRKYVQYMIRQYEIHTYILNLLKNEDAGAILDDKKVYFQQIALNFLLNYARDNSENQKSLLGEVELFIELADQANSLILEQQYRYMGGMDHHQKNRFIVAVQKQLFSQQCLDSHSLIKEVLKVVKNNPDKINPYIEMIFGKVRQHPLFNAQQSFFNAQQQIKSLYPNIARAQQIIQMLKILRSLTQKEYSARIKPNQMKILNLILQSAVMKNVVQPIPIEYWKLFGQKFDNLDAGGRQVIHTLKHQKEVFKLKIHVETIKLITDLVTNYRQGIQEIQRIVMFDTLKAVICHPEQPYLVKRVYLRLLFEVFINKIHDEYTKIDNENIDSEEISEILNSEIIPQVRTPHRPFFPFGQPLSLLAAASSSSLRGNALRAASDALHPARADGLLAHRTRSEERLS